MTEKDLFEEWFNNKLSALLGNDHVALNSHQIKTLKANMRMSWKAAGEVKDKVIKDHLNHIEALKTDIIKKEQEKDDLQLEIHKLNVKIVGLEREKKKK